MNYIRIIGLVISLAIGVYSFGQQVVVNEIMSDNESVIQDADGDFSDWIEIYNNSDVEINITGYSLSDDAEDLNKWIFPSISIPAHGFLLVFASSKDIDIDGELHTNFKIKKTGEDLFLCDANFDVISMVEPVSLQSDCSFASIFDGSENRCIVNTPTPNSSNINTCAIYCSHASGFYNESFTLSLISNLENNDIYYTLNGSPPTINSNLYTNPLVIENNSQSDYNISGIPTTPLEGPSQLDDYIWVEPESVYKCNTIRFASFSGDTIKSKIYSKTYFVDNEIESRYTFPIISLVTDSLNLYDNDTGIYIPGKRFEEEGFVWYPQGNYLYRGFLWERDINISYFENDGNIAFETDAGIRMRGYGSASYPQKSFCIYFRSEYGENKVEYPVFSNSNTDEYKRLVFRNSGNDFLQTHFRDALLQSLLNPLDLEIQNLKPSIVFINGEYWGIYNIREKYDDYYFKYHLGIEEDNINMIDINEGVEEGSDSSYIALQSFFEYNPMTIEANYTYAKSKIDIPNFIDFMIAEIYYANYDWPSNNYKLWNTNDADSKWRFLIFDLDLSFAYDYRSYFDTPSLDHAHMVTDHWPHIASSNLFFRKLLKNDEFRQDFLDRFLFHLNNTFNKEVVLEKIDQFEEIFTPEMEEHIKRWGYPYDIYEWRSQIDVMREFAEKRPCYMPIDIINFFELESFDFECEPRPPDITVSDNIIVIPNPSNGILHLYNDTENSLNGSISIVGITGQIVYQKENVSIDSGCEFYINLTQLSSNTYILKFKGSDVVQNIKLVIIK